MNDPKYIENSNANVNSTIFVPKYLCKRESASSKSVKLVHIRRYIYSGEKEYKKKTQHNNVLKQRATAGDSTQSKTYEC